MRKRTKTEMMKIEIFRYTHTSTHTQTSIRTSKDTYTHTNKYTHTQRYTHTHTPYISTIFTLSTLTLLILSLLIRPLLFIVFKSHTWHRETAHGVSSYGRSLRCTFSGLYNRSDPDDLAGLKTTSRFMT